MNFKIGDFIVLKSFPDSSTTREIVGETNKDYLIRFNKEAIVTHVSKLHTNKQFRKLSKLEKALK